MKKICIVTKKLVTGGIEKALIEMIKNLKDSNNNLKIVLFIMHEGGELEKSIPNNVEIRYIFDNKLSNKERAINEIKSGRYIKASKRVIFTALSARTKNVFKSYKLICKTVSSINEEFDLAISYHTPISFPIIYTIDKINAKKKVAWIHSDLNQYKGLIEKYKGYYSKYDQFFCVSKEGVEKFKIIFPNMASKVSVFYNSIYKDKIKKLSLEEAEVDNTFKGITIATVGRLSREKGYDFIVNILKKLLSDNHDVRWVCVGDGLEYKEIEKKIKFNNLKENIILTGNKENPYPYIKNCDIYVQPSRYEGYCTTVTEAKCLEKPMVVTNVNGMKEQIINNKNGIITEVDENQIYNAIEYLIINDNIRDEFHKELCEEEIDTRAEVDKLIKFL